MKKSGSQKGKSPSQLIDAGKSIPKSWRSGSGEGSGVVARRIDLHRRDLQEGREDDLPKGAAPKDPSGLFNASLDGNTRRAIDFHEGENARP